MQEYKFYGTDVQYSINSNCLSYICFAICPESALRNSICKTVKFFRVY